MEKPATEPVVLSTITQHRRCSRMKLVKHNKMCRQVSVLCIVREIVSNKPCLGAAVEQVGFVGVVARVCKIRFARQKIHRDVTMQIAA